jgi:hypothetical protein
MSGPGTPIFLWVVCFLAVVFAIRLVSPLQLATP